MFSRYIGSSSYPFLRLGNSNLRLAAFRPPAREGLRPALFRRLAGDPLERPGGDEREQEQVILPEAGGVPPLLALLVSCAGT